VLLVVAALSACGVGTDAGVTRADPDEVPFGLLEEEPRSSLTPAQPSDTVQVHLYDDAAGVLRPVDRAVPTGSLAGVLAELQEGPTAVEGRIGLTSALDGTTAIGEVRQEGDGVVIDLGEDFQELVGGDQVVAIGQMVFTATGRPGVQRVSFTLEGAAVQVPTGDGSVSGADLDRGDFSDLAPP
jgi:spore germination protein GerM